MLMAAAARGGRLLAVLAVFWLGSTSGAAGLEEEGCLQKEEPSLDWQEDGGALHFLQRASSRSLESGRTGQSYVQPAFTIDLDLPPRDRFREIARWKASAFPPDDPAFPLASDGTRYDPVQAWINRTVPEWEQREWLELAKSSIGAEYLEEMRGAEEEFGIAQKAYGKDLPFATTVDGLILQSIIYELAYDGGCSGILVALPNGTVLHGRNMDYYILGFNENNNLTQQLTFTRGGVPIFTSIVLGIPFEFHTALRFGGWSIEQNAHHHNGRLLNLPHAKAGGKFGAWEHRRLLETVPDFETAVSRLRETQFLAPQYTILAGAGPDEGTVLTFDRAGVRDAWPEAGYPSPMVIERRLAPASGTWYLAQTNDNAWDAPADDRRVFEQQSLEVLGRGNMTPETLMQLLQTLPAKATNTIFSWVTVPATNFTHLITSKDVFIVKV